MRTLTSPGLAVVLACLFSACPRPANAVPIDFSESVGGDLSHPLNPNNSIDFDSFQSFTADSGSNILAGSYHYSEIFGARDRDSFALLIPETMNVVSATLEISNVRSTPQLTSWLGSVYLRGTEAILDTEGFCVVANGGPGCPAVSSYPLPLWQLEPDGTPIKEFDHGTFYIMLAPSFSSGSGHYSLDFDWRLTFVVDGPDETVPEPGTLGLIGFALAALGLVGRRRRSAARRKTLRR